MEDHKRKSKKRNQNKRPTADQIKKLQTTVEQRKEVNGCRVEQTNGTTSTKDYQDAHRPEDKQDNQGILETNETKKNKKKSKQQKPKQAYESNNQVMNRTDLDKKFEKSNGMMNDEKQNEAGSNNLVMKGTDHFVEKCERSNGMMNDEIQMNDDARINAYNPESQNISKSSISMETVATALKTANAEMTNNHDCHRRTAVTSNCYQYHGNEAPTCSYHIQHHANNINIGDIKIDFDVQKLLSPIGSPMSGNKEYFYKGYNVDQIEVEEKENTTKIKSPEKASRNVEVTNLPTDNTQKSFDVKENLTQQPDEMIKSIFAAMESQTFNPEAMLKTSLGGNVNNPNGLLNSSELSQREPLPINVAETTTSYVNQNFNPQDSFQNIFKEMGKTGTTEPLNSNYLLKNMFQQTGNNPAKIFEAILGDNHTTPDPADIPVPDLFSQMNSIAQQMNPTIVASMGQMVANMDPTLLQGVNNMVASMMQGKGLDIDSLHQLKSNHIQKSQVDLLEKDNKEEKQKNGVFEESSEPFEKELSNIAENCTEKIEYQSNYCDEKEEVLKCSFSFSSNESDQSVDVKDEKVPGKEIDSTVNNEDESKKIIRFIREESIPELLETLTKVNTTKEVTTDRIEIKTGKFKAIINKVLKKENKSINGNLVSSSEVTEQHMEYQNKNHDHKQEIDYERLEYVKEPSESRRRNLTPPPKPKRAHQKALLERNPCLNNINVKKQTSEQNKEVQKSFENREQGNDTMDLNLGSMNDIFTNLLQGGKITADTAKIVTSDLEKNKSDGSPISTSNTNSPFETIMTQNMSNMFNSLLGQHSLDNETTGSNKTPNISLVDDSMPNQNQNEFLLNLKKAMMNQFIPKTPEDAGPPQENFLESMTNMFEKIIPNKDEIPPNFGELLANPERMAEILKMGEMFFGTNTTDLNGSNTVEDTKGEVSTKGKNVEIDETHGANGEKSEDIQSMHISKNVHQDERPSVLLKKLLGEKFWSIKKESCKKNGSEEKTNKKNKSKPSANEKRNKETDDSIVDHSNSTSDVASTSAETTSFPAELQQELEKESPLVRMLHKRLQKDTKLQEFLKDKLKKDPKMQKFIQDRLRKDERIQKFMREKLSNDEALRQSFEDKFKNELGLTDVVPRFDDAEVTNNETSTENNKKGKIPREKNAEWETNESKPKKYNAREKLSKIQTGRLFRIYAELTCVLVAIVYAAILCY